MKPISMEQEHSLCGIEILTITQSKNSVLTVHFSEEAEDNQVKIDEEDEDVPIDEAEAGLQKNYFFVENIYSLISFR